MAYDLRSDSSAGALVHTLELSTEDVAILARILKDAPGHYGATDADITRLARFFDGARSLADSLAGESEEDSLVA